MRPRGPRTTRENAQPLKPNARRDGLVIQELPDETLVYDLRRERAHCLNRTAASVWRRCDGQTTIGDLAQALHETLDLPADEAIVWMALERLDRAHLLVERLPTPGHTGRHTRREVLRRLGAAGGLAVLLPAVQSIVAPEAVQAASGVTASACFQNPTVNAGKCCIDTNPHRLCRKVLWFGLCTGSVC